MILTSDIFQERKIQQILYPDSCERIHWEGRIKLVKNMNRGLMNSEYQQGHQRNRFTKHSVNYFSRVRNLQNQLTEIRGDKIRSIGAENQITVSDRESKANKVYDGRQFSSVNSLFKKRGQRPRSVQCCPRSSSFVSSESNCNITSRFEAAN